MKHTVEVRANLASRDTQYLITLLTDPRNGFDSAALDYMSAYLAYCRKESRGVYPVSAKYGISDESASYARGIANTLCTIADSQE